MPIAGYSDKIGRSVKIDCESRVLFLKKAYLLNILCVFTWQKVELYLESSYLFWNKLMEEHNKSTLHKQTRVIGTRFAIYL